MKTIGTVLTICMLISLFTFAQDEVPGSHQVKVSPRLQTLYNQINTAENNGDWSTYRELRSEIIAEWNKINPEMAKLYRNVNSGSPDITADGMPANFSGVKSSQQTGSFLFESPAKQSDNILWGNDVKVTGGMAYDFSMDISRDGDIYMAVMGRLDGTSTVDSVYIYKSTNGGESWEMWSSVFASTHTFKQVELMCFDGYPGSGGDSYLLLFYLFSDGWLRVAQTETAAPGWNYYTVAGSSGGGWPTDFAVDRNYPAANYRAICVYDSSNIIKSVRSDPASAGTLWQDAAPVGGATLGKDVDLCYGVNGGVYVSFNGFNSGNLYVIENTNAGDPGAWGSRITLVTGTTDTTRHSEVISTRDNIPGNIAAVVYERQSGFSYDLYACMKDAGSSTWGSPGTWVIPDENKWPSLYSFKENGNQVFRGVFERSLDGNGIPRDIRYKYFDGSIWQQSETVSDEGIDVTGIQKPEVGDLDGNTPVFAYAGANFVGVYFDNSSWTPPGTIMVTSPNGGENWEAGSSNDITYAFSGVTDVHIELSTDNGSTWSDIEASTPASGTYSWAVPNTPSTDCLVRVSDASNASVMDVSDAVFTITPPVGVKETDNLPHTYGLSQNFPDPFNPSTMIRYQLPETGFVTLKVYDILGNEVASLINEQKPAGRYEMNFDASRLTSGIYIYQIQVNNYVSSKKMMLVK